MHMVIMELGAFGLVLILKKIYFFSLFVQTAYG